MTDKMGWIEYNDGITIGTRGSEEGIIIKDEEYQKSCCITLEKTERGYAITCGVYGAMVHTAFANKDNYLEMYSTMKRDLAEFIDKKLKPPETYDFYDEFTRKY